MSILRKCIISSLLLVFVWAVPALAQEEQSTDPGTIDSTLEPLALTKGVLKKVGFVYMTDWIIVTDETGTAFSETVKMKSSGCLSVKVSSQADIHDNDSDDSRSMHWQVLLDGSTSFNGPYWWVPANPGYWDTYTGNFWLCDVPAGTHIIDVQFYANDSGDDAMVGYRTLEIHYKK